MQEINHHMTLINQQNQALAAQATSDNPLFQDWAEPFGVPPFGRVEPEHFLPAFARAFAAHAAEVAAIAGKHVVTTSRSSVEPFLQFSERRDLREKIFRRLDRPRRRRRRHRQPKAIIAETAALREERAHLLGYASYAHYRLDDAMAKTPQAVRAPARAGVGAGASACDRRPRCAAGAGRRPREEFRTRPVGLALLRREAAQAALRCG